MRASVGLLDLGLTPEVDIPVVEAVEHLHERLAGDGIELCLSHLRPDTRDRLDRAGALAAIGPERVCARLSDGILVFALRMPGAAERVTALNDLLALMRERAAQPSLSAEAVGSLTAHRERLSVELSAAGGASTPAANHGDLPPRQG